MKRKGPPFGRPDQVAVQSNQPDCTRPLLSHSDAPTILDAWRDAVDALDSTSLTLRHLVGRLLRFVEYGTTDERDLALLVISDVATRRGLSREQGAEFLLALRNDVGAG